MKLLILLILLTFSYSSLFSQKLFIKNDSTYSSFGEYFMQTGNSLTSTSLGDSIFIPRGAEAFSYDKSELPYHIDNGVFIYPALKVRGEFDQSQPSHNSVTIANSQPRYFREFRAPPPRNFSANAFYKPRLEYKNGETVYVGLGADSTGSLIFITIEDSIAQIFRRTVWYEHPDSLFKIEKIPLYFPEGINKSRLATVIFHIWEDETGILILYDGLHLLRLSENELNLIKTFNSKHSVVRERISPFKVVHTVIKTP